MDNRVCMHYVLDRLEEIWDLFQKDTPLGLKELDAFKRECIYNLGVNLRNDYKSIQDEI
mgnify:CR=1 FL=1